MGEFDVKFFDLSEQERQARERASIYAPPPPITPFGGAVIGAIAAGVIVTMFVTLAGIDLEGGGRFEMAAAWTMLIGGGAPYFILRRKLARHQQAHADELRMERDR